MNDKKRKADKLGAKEGVKKNANEFYESDLRNMNLYTKMLLGILGIWPMVTNRVSKPARYFSKMLILLSILSMAFLFVPTSLHVMLRVRDKVSARVSIGYISPCLASILKYLFIIYHSESIKKCMGHMERDWMNVASDIDRGIMAESSGVEHVITAISSIFLYTGGIFLHAVMPLIKGSSVNYRNETIRPLPAYPGYDLFVDTQKSPTYEIIYCAICFSAFIRFTVTITTCNLAALFVTHACGQVKIVMSRLERLFDGMDKGENIEEIETRISSLLLCHVRGLRLSSIIDDALKEICLVEVVFATLILCLLEYYVMDWQVADKLQTITFFLLLVSYTYNIYILCYIGELLKEQFEEVGKSAYMIEWYRIPEKKGLCVVLMIAMSNYPHKITAGGMMELSICTFGLIMKTSIIYQNMLRTLS